MKNFKDLTRTTMNAFLVMHNRLEWPRKMAEFLSDTGCNVILIDNQSSYPPLLEWYKSCPYKIHMMDTNYGHLVLWKSGLINEYNDQHYILSDPDLSLDGIPHDYVSTLMRGLTLNPNVIKSALSLEITDLPDNAYAKQAYDWELKFWQTKNKDGFYRSTADTTFAMYDQDRKWGEFPGGNPSNDRFFDAVRSDRPYTARHLPWYVTPENMTDEEKYYHMRTNTYWAQKYNEAWS